MKNQAPRVGFFLFILVFSALNVSGQSQKDLEAKRKQLFKEIEKTNKLLDQTKNKKKNTLNNYYALKKQIDQRHELITTLQQEISITEDRLAWAEEIVKSLSYDVEELQEEYATMAKNAYRMKLRNTDLAFLFSAKSLNEVFRRWRYLEQYESYRSKQAELITDTQEMLISKTEVLDNKRLEKEKLLQFILSQRDLLEEELTQKDALLARLQKDESILQKDLKDKHAAHIRMGKAIEKIILSSLAKADLKAIKKEQNSSSKANEDLKILPTNNTADQKLSQIFWRNKGALPWPVDHGIVTGYFGTHNHPELKRIKISNNGIDIQTKENAAIKASFDGIVAGVQYIPGNNYMVILKHGNYFSVYSNLKEVKVKRNEKVQIGSQIGYAGIENIANHYELHFEIWYGKERQNPMKWLKQRS